MYVFRRGRKFQYQYIDAPFLLTNHSALCPLTYTIHATIFALLVACCGIRHAAFASSMVCLHRGQGAGLLRHAFI
jgi:hypothetical protein